jgi:hypothetical protein
VGDHLRKYAWESMEGVDKDTRGILIRAYREIQKVLSDRSPILLKISIYYEDSIVITF